MRKLFYYYFLDYHSNTLEKVLVFELKVDFVHVFVCVGGDE